MNDIEIIREALHHADDCIGIGDRCNCGCSKANAALSRVEERTLPELPDGWLLCRLSQSIDGTVFYATLIRCRCFSSTGEVSGETPRSEVLAAIKKIGEIK